MSGLSSNGLLLTCISGSASKKFEVSRRIFSGADPTVELGQTEITSGGGALKIRRHTKFPGDGVTDIRQYFAHSGLATHRIETSAFEPTWSAFQGQVEPQLSRIGKALAVRGHAPVSGFGFPTGY